MKAWAFLLGAIVAATPSWALDPTATLPQLLHRQWHVDDGLPHASVRSLAQSPDGFLWVGTQSGLAHFDGIGFEVQDHRSQRIFENDQIESLATGPDGVLWIGTYGGGLLRLEKGNLRRFGREDGLTVPEILELAVDPQGELWVGTHGGGVLRFANGRLEVLVAASRLPDPIITGLIFGARGELFITTASGVHVYQGGRFEEVLGAAGIATASGSVPSPFLPMRIRNAARRAAGGLWLATDGGLLRWDGFRLEDPFSGAGPRRVLSVLEDRDGNVFFGTYDGLFRMTRDGELTGFAKPHPEADSVVWQIFEDREGALWIGTLGGGLRQLSNNELRTWGVSEGLPSNLVTSIHQDPAGRLLVTTRNAGLAVFERGRFTTLVGLPDEDLWAAYSDPQKGDLWVGSSGNGLLRKRGGVAGNSAWERYGVAEGLGAGAVFGVLGTRNGDIWAATNGGLSRYRAGNITNFTTRDGLAANEVRALLEDRHGRLWVGTNAGLSLLLPGDRFRSFSAADLFPEAGVAALLEDLDTDSIWLGTLGAGLMRYRPSDGDLHRFQAIDGIVSDDIGFLVQDTAGYFWLGTSSGLVRVAKKELEAQIVDHRAQVHPWTFDRRHGLRGTVWAQSAGASRSRDGRLYFATRGGFVEVDPQRLVVDPSPPLTITPAPAQRLPWSPKRPLSPPAERLSFRFSAPFQHGPEAFRLRYRLVGFDRDWRLAKNERERVYRSVPPGLYSFEVEASDEEGRFSGRPVAVPVKVRARWFGPLAFAFVALALLTLGVVFLQKLRLQILQRRERELERQVERALAELKVLRGMLPICSLCKKIRDDEGYWEDLGAFVSARSAVAFTDSFCPDCERKKSERRASSEKVARLVRAVPGADA